MAQANVELRIQAKDEASRKLQGITGKIQGMSRQMRIAGAVMMGAGIAIAAGLFKITEGWAKAGDEVAKMSKRIGASTEWLSKMRYAAEISGTSLEGVEKAFKRFAKTLDDAKMGLETYTREFDRLGIGLEELEGMKPEDAFLKVALAIAEIEDPLERAAAAQNMFGRSGAELLPLLADGADGIEALMQKAEDMGLVFDAEAAAAAERFNDSLTDLKTSLMGVGAQLAEVLAPKIADFIEKVSDIVIKVKDWADANPWLAETILKFAGALIGAGGLLIALSMISKAIVAVNAALIIMHSLTGVGLLKMAVGAVIAGGAILAMNKAITGAVEATPEVALPGAQRGGIVTRPTALIAGEAGPEAIIPLRGGMGGTYNVFIQAGLLLGTEQDWREVGERVLDVIREDERRTYGVSA